VKYAIIFGLAIIISGGAACAVVHRDEVHNLLAGRHAYDQKEIEISGELRVDHEFVNLFSKDRSECIGLLTHVEDLQHYAALHGRRVHVRGILDAEGCGQRGMCVHQLCGPAILRNVTVRTGP